MARPQAFLHGNFRIAAATLVSIGSAARVVRAASHTAHPSESAASVMTRGGFGALVSIGLLISGSPSCVVLGLVKSVLAIAATALGPEPNGFAMISSIAHAFALLALVAVWESAHPNPYVTPAWMRTSRTP